MNVRPLPYEPEPSPSELAAVAERYRIDFHGILGDDAIHGTYPVTLTSDAPHGLATAIRSRARGVPLT